MFLCFSLSLFFSFSFSFSLSLSSLLSPLSSLLSPLSFEWFSYLCYDLRRVLLFFCCRFEGGISVWWFGCFLLVYVGDFDFPVSLTARIRGFSAFRHTVILLLCVTRNNLLLSLPLAITSGHCTLAFVPFYESLGSRPQDSFCVFHLSSRKKRKKTQRPLFASISSASLSF